MKYQLIKVCVVIVSASFIIAGKSSEKCEEYSKLSLGKIKVSRIHEHTEIGKVPTTRGEFPHMALLGHGGEDGEINWVCGGSLISDQYVLTLARCTYTIDQNEISNFTVRLGLYDAKSTENDPNIQDFKVAELIRHPDFKNRVVYDNVGLVNMDGKVKFSKFIRPACLYTSDNIPEYEKLSATGWGRVEFAGQTSGVLGKVYVELFTEKECQDAYKTSSNRRLNKGILHEQMICAGGKIIPRDTCSGDSGGPLQMLNGRLNIYEIVGMTSFGQACGFVNVPGVYVRVSHYVPWIENIVWP